MEKETTNTEILSAINEFATNTEIRFSGIEKRLSGVEGQLSGVEGRLSGIEKDVREIKSTMVTKDYLDDRLAVQKGDMITIIRKEDTKLIALIVKMVEKKLLSRDDAKELLTMEPFPDLRALHSLS